MLSLIQNNALLAISFIAYYGIIYFGIYRLIRSANKAHSFGINDVPREVSSQESSSTVSEPVVQAPESKRASAGSPEQESIMDLSNNGIPLDIVQYDDTPVPYKHEFWPSPRPVNFVKAILEDEPYFKLNGRLVHAKAVDILAERASMSRREFLKTNPLTYSQRFMKGMNALYLLKGSIDKLDHTLRMETYRQQLRRVENGKHSCPVY